ncbi:hypothetical protein PQX77_016952 [Marasmius sp. AFHP31]|nr:hypothetical protein PQX77_016952 [Marasmius sp. AFHP31]
MGLLAGDEYQPATPSPPQTPSQPSNSNDELHRIYHSKLTAQPCDANGQYLPFGTPPAACEEDNLVDSDSYSPFADRFEFELGDFLFRKSKMSGANIRTLMELWAVRAASSGDSAPFLNQRDLYDHIDSIEHGSAPWKSLKVHYGGQRPDGEVPSWMEKEYDVWYRDPKEVFAAQLKNEAISEGFDYRPYREFKKDQNGERQWQNLMSADWAWEQCDKIYEDDPSADGALFCPIIMGSDKTTVSVGTGQNEYYPLYGSLGNLHNNVRRAHQEGIHLLAFLAIPKGEHKYDKDRNFLKFRRQLFHSSLATIFQSLKPAMSKPKIMRCPDGHLRRVIFGLGPYIADYPEQALLSCVVQGWCPKCTAHPDDLDDPSSFPRTRRWTDAMIEAYEGNLLWNAYGIVADVVPFTNDFPRADIHELLTPDLLHQVIKGAFKDHLVEWINTYLIATHGERDGKKIIDDIDRRLAAVPQFKGLRRFPEGRRFSQWTGDDSKALMKVYLPALHGHLPPSILQCLGGLLEFCYSVRREFITESTLLKVEQALSVFHEHREIFRDCGVRDNFSLPRQHSLVHYVRSIRLFGAPNGLCSSITESKHIKAVKEPYRRSNRNQPLGQMLITNQRLDKLASLRSDLTQHHMLEGSILDAAFADLDISSSDSSEEDEPIPTVNEDDEGDDGAVDIRDLSSTVVMARTPQRHYPSTFNGLAAHIQVPHFPDLIRRYLHEQLYPDDDRRGDCLPINECLPLWPDIDVSVFHSATSTFYAPTDPSGIAGMKRETIQATPSWRKGGRRYDCVFVEVDTEAEGMRGLTALRVRLFFSFEYCGQLHECALVEWFLTIEEDADEDTGLWLVEPDIDADHQCRDMQIISIRTILRAAHLIPVFGSQFLPYKFHYSDSMDAFDLFWVNKYADHNSHDICF